MERVKSEERTPRGIRHGRPVAILADRFTVDDRTEIFPEANVGAQRCPRRTEPARFERARP